MKNINSYTKANITTLDKTFHGDIASQFAAKRAAEKAYKETRKQVIKAVADTLNAAPEGTVILNSDLARMCGISEAHMASLMQYDGYDEGIRSERVEVTKRYAEIDENGQVLTGAEPLVITKYRAAYRKKNSRGW